MYYYIFAAVIFLLLASFLNVVICRLPRGESLLTPPSHCPVCSHRLNPFDLLPVLSFILLRGKCRYCGEGIAPQHLIVEIAAPLLWMLVLLKWGYSMQALSGLLLTAILLSAAFTDINKGIIPDSISLTGIMLGLGLSFSTIGFIQSFAGALGFGGVFLFIALISRGGMGGGDIKLAALIGAFTGWQGALLVFFISSFLGGLWALGLLLRGNAGLKTPIKFAPFLAIAAWSVWMFQIEIIDVYKAMLGEIS